MMKNILLFGCIFFLGILVGIAYQSTKTDGFSIGPPHDFFDKEPSPAFPSPTAPQQYSNTCAIEQCHGLDITCGANGPDACTEEYRLGDFCRQYVSCKVQNGTCAKVEDPKFARCKSCIEQCNVNTSDPMQPFDCEGKCRQEMEK